MTEWGGNAAEAGPAGRRHPVVRRIGRAWRELTGGAPTLVACSGGADSTALTIALAAAEPDLIRAAHVRHDLRPVADVVADRDAAASLAEAMGIPFDEVDVRLGPGNAEDQARRARYEALARIADRRGCPFVATAHHADDQLESMVMALVRGAGPGGLAGIAPRRELTASEGQTISLVRPMLGVSREQARRLCKDVGAAWREDSTNRDVSRLRAAVRHGAAAHLKQLRPAAPKRAAESAETLRDAAGLVRDRAGEVFGDRLVWPREALRDERAIVLGAGLRAAAMRLTDGLGADALPKRRVEQVVRAIRDQSTEPRRFDWPGGVVVRVEAGLVRMFRKDLNK